MHLQENPNEFPSRRCEGGARAGLRASASRGTGAADPGRFGVAKLQQEQPVSTERGGGSSPDTGAPRLPLGADCPRLPHLPAPHGG